MINVDYLASLLSYNPDTGLFYWKTRRSPACTKGWFKGNINARGYCTIRVDGTLYYSHRLAWLLMTGSFPKQAIDHIDENKTNNAFSNLRLASKSLNELNQIKAHKDSSSKLRKTTKHLHKWKAQFRGRYVGLFSTPSEAHNAYCLAKENYHH